VGTVAIQSGITDLLEQAGARPRGNRHDCPKCGGLRTVTHTAERFYCHHCQWKGNAITLAKELGMYHRLPSAEYRELRQSRERADRAARQLYERVKARRMELLDLLHSLNRLETAAHDAGPDSVRVWDVLEVVYGKRPGVLAELAVLENYGAAALIRFLNSDAPERESTIAGVIERGGLYDSAGRFAEVNP
jgi:ribosomal protein L37AE/L43A